MVGRLRDLGVEVGRGPTVVQDSDISVQERRHVEVGQDERPVDLVVRRQRARVREVGEDQLEVAPAGHELEVVELVGQDAPDHRRRDRVPHGDRPAPQVLERLRLGVGRHGQDAPIDVVLPEHRRRPAGLLLQEGNLERGDRDNVGVAAGVDAKLVPGRLLEDPDPRLLLHLLADPGVLEEIPDGVGREREPDHPFLTRVTTATGVVVAATDHAEREHRQHRQGTADA